MIPWIFDRLFGRVRSVLYLRRRFPDAKVHYTARVMGAERIFLAEAAHVGRRTTLHVMDKGALHLAQGAWLGNDCEVAAGGNVVIGARSSIQHRSQLHGDVTIGAGCVCAANLYVSSSRHAFDAVPALPIRIQDRLASRSSWAERSRPVVIGDDCWIGINVVVLPGITIGRGCVIGANSVVSKDVPPYSVMAGVPARSLRTRLDFRPPAMLDASNDSHLPYFYAGFQQLAVIESGDTAVPRLRGGLCAEGRFTVALDVFDGQPFDLVLDVSVAGRVSHGNTVHALQAGVQTVHFIALQGRWQTLDFEWAADVPAPPNALVIKGVRVQRESDFVGTVS